MDALSVSATRIASKERTHLRGEATVLRGTWSARVAVQLALGTQWDARSPLDVLVMDMPPGTGDVQMALLNSLPLTAAVVISTPSLLASPDVQKGLEMLSRVDVPVLGLVENFSWYDNEISKEELCLALRQWLPNLPPDAADDAKCLLGKLEARDLVLPSVSVGRRVPFGQSTLYELLEVVRQSSPRVEGFQLPMMKEMAADALWERGQRSERTFSALAQHVHGQLCQLPAVAQQQNTLTTGNRSITEFENWHRFLAKIKYLHYA